MIERQRRIEVIAFFAMLLIVDWALYFRHARHFFQGDAIFLIDHRATSIPGYLNEFIALNPSGWFRPLANELIESVLYPIAGLHPVPYRIPLYVLFLLITVAVYALTFTLTRRRLAAGLATFFFTIHTTNAYATYDLGFMPELLYTLFYLSAVLAFLRYLERGSTPAYRLSLLCLIAGLLSKESSISLPATLFLIGIVFTPGSRSFRERVIHAVRSTAPHMVIAALYAGYALCSFHVAGVSMGTLLDRSQKPNPQAYIAVLNDKFFANAQLAFVWAFNIPRGWWGQWQHLTAGMMAYLNVFRAFALVLITLALIRPDRKIVLFGIAWFWITLIPPLALVNSFVPHYLFLPSVGLSLVVGFVSARAYDSVQRFQPLLATTGLAVVFAGLLYVNNRSIRGNIYDNRLLGGSAKLASDTLNDLKGLYPALPADARLYFTDADEPLYWEHDYGKLVKLVYATDRISILYQSQGDALPPGIHDPLVFGVRNGRLIDETAFYRDNSSRVMNFVDADLTFDLSPPEVMAGQGRYTLRIPKFRNTLVEIAYTVNGGPLQVFTASLNADGEVTFDVSDNTKKGIYKFWALTTPGAQGWFRANQTLWVR
jgi:hypothetical protein